MLQSFILRYFEPDTGSGGNTGESPKPDGQGNNQGQAGSGTQPQTGAGPLVIPAEYQPAVDQIVRTRLSEQDTRLKTKFQTELEAKLAEAKLALQGDTDKLVNQKVQEELTKRAMDATRLALKSQYNLSEAQVARLQGDTAEDLQKDAEAIYGAFVQTKTPPALPTGGDSGGTTPPAAGALNLDNMTPEQIRQNAGNLWKQLLG